MSRAHKAYEFTVEGMDDFPVDMLRYDECYPADQNSVVEMGVSLDTRMRKLRREREENGKHRTFRVRLRSYHHGPTEGRWQSFGWKVTEQSERRIEW